MVYLALIFVYLSFLFQGERGECAKGRVHPEQVASSTETTQIIVDF